MRLAADEPVEVFESASASRPGIKGAGWTGLPDRHFMALAELRRRVSIQLERPGEWCARIRQNRVIARRSAGDFRDSAHADSVVVASGQQGLSRRRTQCRGMKTGVFQATRRKVLSVRRVTWAAKSAARSQSPRRQSGRSGRSARPRAGATAYRRVLGVRVLRIIGDQAGARRIGDGKHVPLNVVLRTHLFFFFRVIAFVWNELP